MSVNTPTKTIMPTKTTMLTPVHPVTKALVRVVHQAATAVLRRVAPNAPIRPYGLHPLAWQALLKAGVPPSRIGQTIGNAKASAGTHAKDGEYQGHDYAACTDFHIPDYSDAQNYAFCTKLAGAGYAPYYRKPGVNGWPSRDARHDHAIWPACHMKPMVQNQIHDYLRDRNGLVSHETYLFRPPTKPECDDVRTAFLANNHG